jgi:hypothetical protein
VPLSVHASALAEHHPGVDNPLQTIGNPDEGEVLDQVSLSSAEASLELHDVMEIDADDDDDDEDEDQDDDGTSSQAENEQLR